MSKRTPLHMVMLELVRSFGIDAWESDEGPQVLGVWLEHGAIVAVDTRPAPRALTDWIEHVESVGGFAIRSDDPKEVEAWLAQIRDGLE